MVLNYVNSLIYKMVNALDDKIYVGSTCGTLRLRKSTHKSASKIKPNRKVYEHFNRIGWENVRIILIETFPCDNRDELLRREQYFIDLLQPELNKYSSYVNCPHGRQHSFCITCGGSQMCEHNRQKSQCIPCCGSQICEHNRIKSQCITCKGSQICEHNRRKSQCITCKGSQICEHNRRKSQCKICNAGKYQCDYCCKSFVSKSNLKTHYNSIKHKLKFISTFEEVFGKIITMAEAKKMDFQ